MKPGIQLMGKNFIHFCSKRILAVAFLLLGFISVKAQVPANGDFRTSATGWQVRSGGVWVNTASFPTSANNVYVQNGHNAGNDGSQFTACKDLHINTGSQFDFEFIFQIYGKLRAYTGPVVTGTTDGTFYSGQVSSANPPDYMLNRTMFASITFKGTTRNITNSGEWGISSIPMAVTFDLNPGSTGTFQTAFKADVIIIASGTVNMGLHTLYPEANFSGYGGITINSGATLISANSGASAGNCVIARTSTAAAFKLDLHGNLILTGASPYIQSLEINIFPGSIIEYAGAGNQSFVNASYAGAVPINTYRNLVLSGSGNKTPLANFDVKEDITISGSAVLVMGSRTADITGDWTSYGAAGLNEGTSTVNFDSTGAQTINTTGGESFYVLRKSNTGTLSFNSNVAIAAGGNLDMESGTIDANTNTFSGTATSAFNMTNGTIKLAKLNATLPEFLIPSYNITNGTIELDGAGIQTLRGARDYRNLTFSNSGTKGITSAINNITGTVRVTNSVVLDVLNNTMGGTGTNLTMTGTSVYKTAGSSQVKPDATGTYSLGSGTTVDFTNSLAGLESIRFQPAAGTVNYYNLVVSGTSVGTASLATGISFQSGGSFRVKNGAVFKQTNTTGFSGLTTTSISSTNNPSIILEAGSTVEYNGTNQTISNQTINTPATANYEGLLLSGTGNKTAPSGTLTIKGDLAKTGTTTFIHNSGTVVMNGTAAQDYTAAYPFMKFYNFTNNNTVDLSINNEMSVVKELAFGANSKLNLQTGSHIILISNSSGTANVGKIPVTASITYTGTGKFTVERYIPTGSSHSKSWQFLATPTNGGQTVNQAWQDTATAANQSRYGGYGTQITSNISPLPSRFDVLTLPGPSMKTYNAATNSWTGIANTTTLPIYNQKGYMVFVRGDRTVTTSNGTANQTVLRTSGRIFNPVSNIPPVTNVASNQFESIGNPYASAIDFSNDAALVKSVNIQKIFYVWDPKLGSALGYGAYQTFTKGVGADNNYYVSPGGGSYGVAGSINNLIQSGQAFFSHAFGGSGTISFTENAKVSSNSITFRQSLPMIQHAQFRNNLFVIIGTDTVLSDGVLNEFERSFNHTIDEFDAIKIGNLAENISIENDHTSLAVERRPLVANHDTIFYKLGQLRIRQYQFEFTAVNLNRLGLEAFLEDNYLHLQTPISLDTITKIRFEVINAPGSYAPDRFRVVFTQKKDYFDQEASFASLKPKVK
ncbi:MAG: hypothetical protein ABI741_01460 [Ferruginibacter sp.]